MNAPLNSDGRIRDVVDRADVHFFFLSRLTHAFQVFPWWREQHSADRRLYIFLARAPACCYPTQTASTSRHLEISKNQGKNGQKRVGLVRNGLLLGLASWLITCFVLMVVTCVHGQFQNNFLESYFAFLHCFIEICNKNYQKTLRFARFGTQLMTS